MTTSVTVVGYPRIHITLMDLAGVTSMVPGGVGFSLDAFPTVLTAESASGFSVLGDSGLDQNAREDLDAICHRLRRLSSHKGALVRIESTPPQHVGLGSKTTLLLSVLTAVDALYGRTMSREKIQLLSERGGTSGIGIHSFFVGGLVVDAGRRRVAEWKPVPSSENIRTGIPVLLMNFRFPDNWRVALLSPSAPPISGEIEREFFERKCPISSAEALNAIAQVYHGVVPSILQRDIELLRESLKSISASGFKKSEIEIHGRVVRDIIYELNESNIACGMSSLGPTIYAIFEANDERKFERICSVARTWSAQIQGPFRARNQGAEVLGVGQ